MGGVGEIHLSGDCLARGYIDQAMTGEKFIQDPFAKDPRQRMYRTGDLAKYLPNGHMEYLGRVDRQVKVKGHRIELNDIEAHLLKYPLLKTAAIAVKEESGHKVICAYYTTEKPLTTNELRDFLQRRVPDYMLPSFFMPLASLPISANGKIDYASLPSPFIEIKRKAVTPRNATEYALAQTWSLVLGIAFENLSMEDDFFELGGDSIMAMRILPRLSVQGIQLSIKEIFQYRSIAAISLHVQAKPMVKTLTISQAEVVGSCALTPVQRWFFDLEMVHPDYFNMAYLFKIPAHVDEGLLDAVIRRCLTHHDVLRSRFEISPDCARQIIPPAQEMLFELRHIDLSAYDKAQQDSALKEHSEGIQNQFSISRGGLFACVLVNLGVHGKRLLIAIHHLIIDGVSWRYLVEDIEALYASKLQTQLPLRSHSFIEWSEWLTQKAFTGACNIDYWLSIAPENFSKIACTTSRKSTVQRHKETLLVIDAEITQKLFMRAHSQHDANVGEILLCALFLSLTKAFSIDKLLINHEGHGRPNEDGINVQRTMGWFTAIYPVALFLQNTPLETLRHVKETIREISECDTHYGIARYLHSHKHLQQFQPEVLFNYFGRVGADLIKGSETAFLSNCEEEIGRISHPHNTMPHFLEVNAIAMENCLRICISYDTQAFDENRMHAWIAAFSKEISKNFREKS